MKEKIELETRKSKRYFEALLTRLFMQAHPLLLIDDHPIMLEGVKTLLTDDERIEIVATANKASEALVHLSRKKIDLVITDLSLPDISGLQWIKMIKERYPDLKIIVLSMHDEAHLVKDILKEGVNAYVLKGSTHEDLRRAISKVLDGQRFLSDRITDLIVDDYAKPEGQKLLTQREREILSLIAKEYSNREIGEKLFISERTVETHRKNIFRKTQTNSVIGLMKFAYANGLLTE